MRAMKKNALPRFAYDNPAVLTFALISAAVFALDALAGLSISARFLACPAASAFRFTSPLEYVKIIAHAFSHKGAADFFPHLVCIVFLGSVLEERYGSAALALMMAMSALVEGVFCVTLSPAPIAGNASIAFMMIILWGMEPLRQHRVSVLWLFTLIAFLIFDAAPYVNGEGFAETLKGAVPFFITLAASVAGSLFGFLGASAVNRTPKDGDAGGKTPPDTPAQ